MEPPPALVYLYGPPAVGKLTVAERLAERTGFALFHNHLTVNAIRDVFPFKTPAFVEVVQRLRLDVFATAARTGVSLVFTNNSAWGGPDARERFVAFTSETARIVAEAGGRTVFVQLTAPADVLHDRVTNDSRTAYGKLVDPGRLLVLLDELDPRPLHRDDLVIDTSQVDPDAAAAAVVEHLRVP